jgi:Cation/multidrug efflux pump
MQESNNKPTNDKEESSTFIEDKDIGFSGGLAKTFIHSPLSPLLFIAMMAVGIWGLIATPRQEDPQISVPMIDIFFPAPGLSSSEVASQVVDPFERVLSEIPNIKHVYSASDREYGIITVQFKVGEPMGSSIVQIHSKIQSNLDLLPTGIDPPMVKPKEVDDVPSVTLTLWSEDVEDDQLRILGVSVLQHLKKVPLTGVGFVTGGRSEQMRVEILPERLAGFGVSPGQIVQAIQTANTGHTVGSVEINNKFFYVESGGFLAKVNDLKKLVVGQHKGTPVFLTDVAKITQGPEETKEIVTFSTGLASDIEKPVHGASAVTIALAKQRGSNGVSVVNDILAEVESLKGYLIPSNVHVEVTRNYGESANNKVNDLLFKLFIATGAVTLLVWFSLGIKPSIVVLLTIPVVLVATVFVAMLMGYTIDRVSLFALIFSIGFLVDNAIVIVENIYRRWLMAGSMDTDVAIDAVREVGNPTVLATYTVVAALIPMGFISGMMGPYMEPIPALGSVAMILSLLAALIFAPWLAMRIIPSMEKLRKMEERDEKIDEKMDVFFRKIIVNLSQNKTLGRGFLAGLILSFFGACYMFYNTSVPVKMLPFDDKSNFSIVIDMPDGTALPTTANFTNRIAAKLKNIEEIIATQNYIGTAQPFDFNGLVRHYYLRQFPWQSEIAIQLTSKTERSRTSHEIASAVRAQLQPLAQAEGVAITVVEMPPGPPVLQTVVAEIHGPDAQTRRQVAREITQVFRESERIADVDNLMRSSAMETWRFEIDREKASRQGISVKTINQHLAMVMGEFKVTTIFQSLISEPTHVVLTIPIEKRSNLHRLGDLPIMTMDQRTIPLSELGKFVKVKRDPIIFHKDLRNVEFVVGDAVGRLGAPIYAMLDVERILEEKGYVTPDGVELRSGEYTGAPKNDKQSAFEWTGEWTVTYETFRDMGMAFAVALVAIYMLVVWAFGNFTIPAIIMSPIPLTLLGIVPGHWLLGAEFTATSMIGWIALAGIIVRNSILMVDFTTNAFRGGMSLMDAVILSAKSRTRPILITAFALILGSMVILFDPIFQGMAVSLLFGVFVSTLLTLVVIPLGCISAGEKVFIEHVHKDKS